MPTSRRNPHLIVIRGTAELDRALNALTELCQTTKAKMLLEMIQVYKEVKLGSPKEILRQIQEKRANLENAISSAESTIESVQRKRGRPPKKSNPSTVDDQSDAHMDQIMYAEYPT